MFRGQFQGLKELIDAVGSITSVVVDGVNTLPAGSQAGVSLSLVGNTLHFTFEIPQGQEGLVGPQGPAFSTAVVDGVNTLNPGESATVESTFDGTTVHFTFGIPRGNEGQQGQTGNDGGPGSTGPQGPPFAQAVVDNVTTLNPWEPATVGVSFDGSWVRFTFGLPRGNDGTAGINGTDGAPGEVTNAQLSSAVSGTSNNSNAVSTLDVPFSDPDAESMRLRFNELLLALRR